MGQGVDTEVLQSCKMSSRVGFSRPSDENEGHVGNYFVFTKISSAVSEAWFEFTQAGQRRSSKLGHDLKRNRDTSPLHRAETNRVAASAVRRVKEGATIALVQSGLPEEW